jgi:hypothetical protein
MNPGEEIKSILLKTDKVWSEDSGKSRHDNILSLLI